MPSTVFLSEKDAVCLELLRDARNGNFKSANSSITSQKLEIDDSTAAKIVIECCRLCTKPSVPTINEEELYDLLVTCIKFIKRINNDFLLGYFKSIFFITKYLLCKEKIELVLQMENILIPKFMDSLETSELIKVYTSLCNVLHNTVVFSFQEIQTLERHDELFCQLISLLLKMHFVKLPTSTSVAQNAYCYFKIPKFKETDINLQYNCYVNALQLIKKTIKINEEKNPDDIYSAVIQLLEVVLSNLLSKNEFNKSTEFLNMILLEIPKLFGNQSYLKLFNILCCVGEIIKLEVPNGSSQLLINNFEACSKHLKFYFAAHRFRPSLQRTCNLLCVIFPHLVENYTSCTNLDEEFLVSLFKLLRHIGECISQNTIKCSVCSDCGVKTDLFAAIKIMCLIGKILKACITKQIDVSKSLVITLRYLECCCNFVLSLQSTGCSSWKFSWSDVSITIYNIAVKLYAEKHHKCADYFIILLKYCIKVEGTASSTLNFDILSTCCTCLSQIYMQSYQFKTALLYSALQSMLCSDTEKKFQQWIRVKIRSKEIDLEEDSSLQHLTVICVLQQNEIRHMYPDLNLDIDKDVIIQLLKTELALYKKSWPSKIPMMNVLKKLYEFADLVTMVKVVIQTWGENFNNTHNEVDNLLQQIVMKFELEAQSVEKDEENIETNLYLAALYAMQYCTQTKKVRQRTVDDINRTVITEELPLPPDKVPKNPNDECDLVSSYVSLEINEHVKTVRYLNKALSLFDTYITDSASTYIVSILKEYNMFNIVANIAHEFRLQCNSLSALQACFISLRIARLLNNKMYILQSISFLVEETNMNSEIISSLLAEAENIAKQLSIIPSDEIWKLLTTYHVNKSTMLLHHRNVIAGFEEYQKALTCFSELTGKDTDELLKIRLDFLHVQYLQLSCDSQIKDHNVNSLGKCSQVFQDIRNYIQAQAQPSSFATAILFDINQAVAHMYKWKFLPREVRCYCRNTVVSAQQLVIPLRTAYFLIYLVYADLQSTRLDDCQVKLNGLSSILCLDSDGSITKNEVCIAKPVSKADEGVSNLVEDFAEMMLACPSSAFKYKHSSGSPVLFTKPFEDPPFMKHSSECDCFYCVSTEYKSLVLVYINLKAQLYICRGNIAAAQRCLEGALQLHKTFSRRGSIFKTQVTKLLSCYPFHDLKDILSQTHCTLLLDYGNLLLRRDDVKTAECVNKRLIDLVSERKHANTYLYTEAFLQNLLITVTMHYPNTKSNQNHLEVNPELLVSEDNHDGQKTPECKWTKVVLFPKSYSPRPKSPPKRRVRIKCDFSEKKPKKSDKLPFKVHVSPKVKPSSIKDIFKTPVAASSIQPTPIPSTIKTVKKKLVLQQIPVPSSQGNNEPNERCSSTSSVIPISPDAYTPNSLKVSSLYFKTKLLTQKLKKSAVKNALSNNLNNDPDDTNKPVDDNKICKNLMSELCATESVSKKTTYKKKTQRENASVQSNLATMSTRRTTRANSKTGNN